MIGDALSRMWHEILARPSGPLAVRFYIQPLVAAFLAFRDARWDARRGKPAYAWAVFTSSHHRRELLRDGWHSIGKVFFIALAIDIIYQLIVLHGLHPVQGLIVAAGLALLPYLLLRGLLNRLMRLGRKRDGLAKRDPRHRQRPPRAA